MSCRPRVHFNFQLVPFTPSSWQLVKLHGFSYGGLCIDGVARPPPPPVPPAPPSSPRHLPGSAPRLHPGARGSAQLHPTSRCLTAKPHTLKNYLAQLLQAGTSFPVSLVQQCYLPVQQYFLLVEQSHSTVQQGRLKV